MSEVTWHEWFQLACALGTCVFIVLTLRLQSRCDRAIKEIQEIDEEMEDADE